MHCDQEARNGHRQCRSLGAEHYANPKAGSNTPAAIGSAIALQTTAQPRSCRILRSVPPAPDPERHGYVERVGPHPHHLGGLDGHVGAGLHASGWLRNLSMLHQITRAPPKTPAGYGHRGFIGMTAAVLAMAAFTRRDLQAA